MIALTNGVQLPESSITFIRKVAMDGLAMCDPIRLVQYDDTLPVLAATLWVGGVQYIPPDGADIRIRWLKPDAHGAYNPALGVGDDGTVYIQITQAMTSAAGTGYGNIEVAVDGGVKCSDPIPATISRNAVQEGAIVSTDEFKTLDQILAEVKSLLAQVENDASTASTDAQRAENAREATETAAETVKQIVAGNEAYTKQESLDMFAQALKTDTGKGTSHEIYPDPGSNVVVTAYGFTDQEGEGDPSPKNVRPIKVGGVRMAEYVVTNPENAVLNTPAEGQPYIRITGFPTAVKLPGNKFPPAKYCSHAKLFSGSYTGLYYYLGADAAIISSEFLTPGYDLSTTGLRKKLQDLIDAGDPLTFWYEAEDGSGELYVPDILDAGEKSYRCHCSSITEHLCDGDYVVSSQVGQCVEVHTAAYITVSRKTVTKETSAVVAMNWTKVPKCISEGGILYCSHFPGTVFGTNPANIVINFSKAGFDSSTALLDYCDEQEAAGTPVQVVYKRDLTSSDGFPNTVFPKDGIYTHAPVPLIARPDSTGKVIVSGERDVSAVYSKSIKRALDELYAAILQLGGAQNV